MSSRALRKLQKEEEQQRQLKSLNEQNDDTSGDEEEAAVRKPLNTFDILNQYEEEDETVETGVVASDDSDPDVMPPERTQEQKVSTSMEKPKGKQKPRKKKAKQKGKEVELSLAHSRGTPVSSKASQLDEIDLALKSLSTAPKDYSKASSGPTLDEANLQLYRLLAVESKHLNALNEMKRLFGNVVLENEEEATDTARRRGRGTRQLDLGGALSARNSPISRGQGLAGLALRRNVFMMGKEEWPKGTSGGLGMELVEKMGDGTVEYRFLHNTIYQGVQREFELCVESMDPQRMISLLQYNPYHISTILQVSEIAKQQSDNSVSGDLLERALFTFGRSVHSSFITALSEGKARLAFERPENREFWLAAWRYLYNLSQRGTWRTAYEWAKLILSLDPEGDPYCVAKMLDQLAIRGGQGDHYLQLSRTPFYADDLWADRPNVYISSALAEYRLKQPQKCRVSLSQAINNYPYIFARLFQELNIGHTPKSIWGKKPRTDREKFECELYIHNAKDLWNTPEAISFLVEVAETVEPGTQPPASNAPITLDEARHVILSSVPSLINLIPREFTSMATSASDPLPPPHNLPSYDPTPPTTGHGTYQAPLATSDDNPDDILHPETPPNETANHQESQQVQELRGLQGFFARFLPWLGLAQEPGRDNTDALEQAAEQAGVPQEEILQRSRRMMQLIHGVSHRAREQIIENDRSDPRAATVESDEEGEDAAATTTTTTTRDLPYDDERNRRWLAGQGLVRLREFTAQHGADEAVWRRDISDTVGGAEIVTEYAMRLLQVREQRQRTFLLDYVLRQGTSAEVKALVEREVGRLR